MGDGLGKLRIDPSKRARRGSGAARRWARRALFAAVLAVLAVAAFRGLAPKTPEVDVVRPSAVPADAPRIALSASGYVVPKHKINVNSKVTGRIAWIGVEKGDKVREGQELVRLENDEFRAQVTQAEGALKAAEAGLKLLENGSRPQEIEQAMRVVEQAKAEREIARVTRDRFRSMAGSGVVSRQEVDDVDARYLAADQRVRALEQAWELARIGPRSEDVDRARGGVLQARGALDYAQTQLAATVIRAPVSGTILQRLAEKGELVTAQFASGAEGGPRGSVVSLADLDNIQVELDVSQTDFAKLKMGQRGVVTADAFPDRHYDGAVDEISPEANRQKATVQVKVKIANPDDLLRTEMNARVDFIDAVPGPSGAADGPATLLPAGAVREGDGKSWVWVVSRGKVAKKAVAVLWKRPDGLALGGLDGTEQVVAEPPETIREGDPVLVKGSKP